MLSPFLGMISFTSTSRRPAEISAVSKASSGTKYGVVSHSRSVHWLTAVNSALWIANAAESGPEPMIWMTWSPPCWCAGNVSASIGLIVPAAKYQSSTNIRCSGHTAAPVIRRCVSRQYSGLRDAE